MSIPPLPPSTSGVKPSELHVYTIEECQKCKQKTKRDSKIGDYVACIVGTCEKCQGENMITSIYGEKIQQARGWGKSGRAESNRTSGPS